MPSTSVDSNDLEIITLNIGDEDEEWTDEEEDEDEEWPDAEEGDEDEEWTDEDEDEDRDEDDEDALAEARHSSLPPSSLAGDLSSPPSSPLQAAVPLAPKPPNTPNAPNAHHHNDTGTEEALPRPASSGIFASAPAAEQSIEDLMREQFGDNKISSPIRKGSKEQKAARRREKGLKKRGQTLAQIREEREEADSAEVDRKCASILAEMEEEDVSLADLLKYVSDPAKTDGKKRWYGLFQPPGAIEQILGWWSTQKSKVARGKIRKWATAFVGSLAAREAKRITRKKLLQTAQRVINNDLVTSFDLQGYTEALRSELAPTAMAIITAFTTSRYAASHSAERRRKTGIVITIVALMCLGEYSRANNLIKRIMGLYLYASGALRQLINVLSKLGLCESYSSLVSTRLRRFRKRKKVLAAPSTPTPGVEAPVADAPITPPANIHRDINAPEEGQRLGTLLQLSDSNRKEARDIAATGLYGVVYDNINVNFSSAEQILGRHDTQENGTCATLFTLNGPATVEDLDIKAMQDAFLKAPELSLDDILLSGKEEEDFQKYLVATVLRIIVEYGGEGFERFKGDMKDFQPQSELKLKPSKTKLYPLPAWHIDESSTTGNIEVVEAIRDELRLNDNPPVVQFLAGDQLSIARQRAIEILRAGHEEGQEGYFWAVHILGLFHTKIADIHGLLLTHWGKPNAGTSNPGSLSFHNTRLDRLPITLTSLPPFRVCRDLVFVSLYARILHCLLLVSGSESLEEYLEKFGTWDDLVRHSQDIYSYYGRSEVVEQLRWDRHVSMTDPETGEQTKTATKGDMVFENGILFIRDALISRELTDSVKSNDPGRIILVLKTLALSFRGTGRLKYAYEMLHFVHHIAHIWPAGIRRIALNNLVLNPSGLPEGGVECDLAQEHMNLLGKVKYKARGSNASWEWFFTIMPTVEALRHLQNHMHDTLGADVGTKHARARLLEDIHSLMDSLKEHRVYQVVHGRVTDSDDPPVPDVIDVGKNQLESAKSPLTEYNLAFRRLQQRRKMAPVMLPGVPTDVATPGLESAATPTLSPTTTPPSLSSPNSAHPDIASSLAEIVRDIPELQDHVDTTEDMIEAEREQIRKDFEEQQLDDGPEESELEEVMKDIEGKRDEDTLRLEGMRDVALDMDELEEDTDSGSDSSTSEGTGESESEGSLYEE